MQTFQVFEPHVGTKFQVMLNGESALDLELAAVEDLTVEDRLRDPAIRSQPFSLIFRGPVSSVIEQSTYDLRHGVLGTQPMFLVPIGPNRSSPQCMQYQAIFN